MQTLIIWILLTILGLALVGLVTVLAGIVRWLSGNWKTSETKSILCPYCQRRTPQKRMLCDWCGRNVRSDAAQQIADLAGMERQLRRMREAGLVDADIAEQLLAKVEECRRRLCRPTISAPAMQPQTVPQAEVRDEAVVLAEVAEPTPAEKPPQLPVWITPIQKAATPPAPPVSLPPKPAPAAPPTPPKKPWLERLSEFLEERNIPLAEPIGRLIGAILIVGPSIALAISFREKLGSTFQFGVFVAFSSAVFGIGLYTYHRWKLTAIGIVFLLMATLLVPLDFLVIASVSGGALSLSMLAAEIAGLAIFFYLLGWASKVLVPGARWLQVFAVVGNAAAVLAIARLPEAASHGWLLTAAGLLPVAVFAGAVGPYLLREKRTEIDARGSLQLFTLVGTSLFALAVAMGLLVAVGNRAEGLPTALQYLAPLFAVTGIPVLLAGLTVMEKTGHEPSLAPYRTAGTAVALAAATAMLLAMGLAWPRPLAVIAVGAVDAATLGYVAIRYRTPLAQAGVIACTTVVYLLGFHVLAGNIPWNAAEASGPAVVGELIRGQSGTALLGLLLIFGALGEWLRRQDRRADWLAYSIGAVVVATVSLIVVTTAALREGITGATDAVLVYGILGLASLGLAAQWRRREFSYLASALLLATSLWAAWWQSSQLARPWTMALLAHAGTLAVAAIVLQSIAFYRGRFGLQRMLRRVFITPLAETSLASSAAALVLLADYSGRDALWMAAGLSTVAAIWLAIAWTKRSPLLVSGSQTLTLLGAVAAAVAWLQRNPWDGRLPVNLTEPRSLIVCGIAMGIVTSAWLAARISLQSRPAAKRLLEPDWPGIDIVAHHAMVAAQFLLAVATIAGPAFRELGASPAMQGYSQPGTVAWLLLGILTFCSVTALWHRWGKAQTVGAMLLLATVPYLAAWQFAAPLAAASALRWLLAGICLVGSAAIWCRRPLKGFARRIGGSIEEGSGPAVAQVAILASTALPVLGLTILAALVQLTGTKPPGPSAGWFAGLGATVSYLVPLVLVIATLVGFALRESRAGFAFAAGLVVQLTVVLGYFLTLTRTKQPIETVAFATAVQLATIAAAVWAIAWLIAGKRSRAWPAEGSGGKLMNWQLSIAQLGNVLLLMPAIGGLVFFNSGLLTWSMAAGSVGGWAALILTGVAVGYRSVRDRRPIQPLAAGLIGMAMLSLLACTVQSLFPETAEWGYRTLMLGWAGYALSIVLATWWIASLRTLPDAAGPPQGIVRATASWVIASGTAAVLLGLKAAFCHAPHEDILWGAAAIAVASLAGAAMAVWRKQEGWAFASAPGVNVAASLVVWYFQWAARHDVTLEEWWVLLVQANVIASAAVALVWLAARKRLYELRAFSVRTSPLLGVQILLSSAAGIAILAPAAGSIVLSPERLPAWMGQLAAPAGWVGLAAVASAAGLYLLYVSPRNLLDALAGVLVAGGVLAMCLIERISGGLASPDWASYHTLMTAWAATALVLLGAAYRLGNRFQSPLALRSWVTVLGSAVVLLAVLHVRHDPTGPWWSLGAILVTSLTLGLLAISQRSPAYVWLSGVLWCAAATVVWIHAGAATFTDLIYANVIALAIAATIWTFAGWLVPTSAPPLRIGEREEPFAHAAAKLGLALAGAMAAVYLIQDCTFTQHPAIGRLEWIALAAIIAATLVSLWDRTARFALPGLYLAGLTAVAMAIDAQATAWKLPPRDVVWSAAPQFAAFLLVAAAMGHAIVRAMPFWRSLRIPLDAERWPRDWLPAAQAAVAALPIALGIHISIGSQFDGVTHPLMPWLAGRAVGAVAVAMALASAFTMASLCRGKWRAYWQYSAFGLTVLLMSAAGWAALDAQLALPWLHRGVVLMVAATLVMLAAAFGPTVLRQHRADDKIDAREPDWIAAAQRSVPYLAGVALLTFAAVLVHEGAYYLLYCGRYDAVPMKPAAGIVVLTALGAMVLASLVFAVVPRLDPLRLDDRRRQAYVYLAEFLILLLVCHVKCTMPHLFRLGIIRDYWMLIAMGIAFAGTSLSELFHRRGMPVLAQPLARTAMLLPLAPALGFFFLPAETRDAWQLAGRSPAVWFLASLFYGILATSQRKARFAAASAVAMNVGLWVLWDRLELGFLGHPQLWLIPLGLCILVAEFVNHDRLTAAQSATARYLALAAIYISSSVEYLPVVGRSVWLPLVLILLSLAGVLVGVVLRVRSFLYMGLVFLLLVIVSMVYYAYVDLNQTWVLWICCILLGLAIFAVVGFYEKRREQMLAAIRQFRAWQR